MKQILLSLFVIAPSLLCAQDYVVTLKGDTLQGKVNILMYDIQDRVQIDEGKKKKNFTAIQVRAVQLKNEIYHPIRSEYGYRLMKVVKSGFLSSYIGRRQNSTIYDAPYLVKRDGNALEVPNLTFKKVVADFLSDCSTIREKIKADALGRKQLDQIITEYNTCMDEQTKANNVASTVALEDPKIFALTELKRKVEADASLATQKDVLDIINDMNGKLKVNQAIPNYQLEGLTSMLKNTAYQPEVEKVIALLKN